LGTISHRRNFIPAGIAATCADQPASLPDGRWALPPSSRGRDGLRHLDPNGIVSSWNPGAQRFKGYLPNEIIGQHFSRFYTEEDQKTGLPAKALAAARLTGRFENEGWRVRKDGTHFWAHVVIDPLRDETGTLVGFAKITKDIMERKEAQAKLDKMFAEGVFVNLVLAERSLRSQTATSMMAPKLRLRTYHCLERPERSQDDVGVGERLRDRKLIQAAKLIAPALC
jgi:PAS domain S-box-containing protein